MSEKRKRITWLQVLCLVRGIVAPVRKGITWLTRKVLSPVWRLLAPVRKRITWLTQKVLSLVRRLVAAVCKRPWPRVLCLLLGIVAAVCGRFALELPVAYYEWTYDNRAIWLALKQQGIDDLVWFTLKVGLVASGFLGVVAILGLFIRHRYTLSLYRKACLLSHAVAWVYGVVVVQATEILMAGEMTVNDVKADSYMTFMWRWDLLWPAFLACAVMAYFYILAWRRVAISQWTGVEETEPARGDRVLENLRTHGKDPCYRKSQWSSVSSHLFVLIILPWLLTFFGCVTPYRVPKGKGMPEVEGKKVEVKRVQKKKKPRRVIVNPQALISLHFPDINDSKTAEEVEKESRDTYIAEATRVLGQGKKGLGKGKYKMGKGGIGEGGWPDGMDNACVRFIRMKYDGSGWNDGMEPATRADMNFLDYFHKLTDFKTASQPEAHGITLLAKYPKGYAPPFVYMTGDGGIRVSDREVKVMREYLMGGGMLFADCGSPSWNNAFQSFIKRVFPGENLLMISDDDTIFQVPFPFENGAPPIWHHGGRDAMGIKVKGRWAVFYHPGDINDAWKNNRGGLSQKDAEGALEMGVNIIYYAFSEYLELTRKYRR